MSLIPNTFQCPNLYIDVIDQYLTSEEFRVLTRAIRETFGWDDTCETNAAQISLSTFEHGNTRIGSAGIGLSREAIIRALDALHAFKILVKTEKPNTQGQNYELNLDEKTIDFDGLKKRLAEKNAANKQRTAKARKRKADGVYDT